MTTNFHESNLFHSYRKNSFFISGYLNSLAQLLTHLKRSTWLEVGEEQNAHSHIMKMPKLNYLLLVQLDINLSTKALH